MTQAIFQHHRPDGTPYWLCAQGQVGQIQAHRPEEVLPALRAADQAADSGLHVAGFVSYEAAAGIDPCLATHEPGGIPLLWLGLFTHLAEQPVLPVGSGGFSLGDWEPSVSLAQYRQALDRVKAYIAAGDTYQVNYTYRLRATFDGEPLALFARLGSAQNALYSAYVDMGPHVICSASPELFFAWEGDHLLTRPMKGTAPRGATPEQDRQLRQGLIDSAKDRAENAMIVDMMRNDMGRIARPHSVRVASAFDIEDYPTLFQMTSTVEAAIPGESFADIMRALFPCASITGAPKVRTMQIIRELEGDRRGVYTGCVGYLSPGRRARFNVAIRTVAIDRRQRLAEYGVGGGIVWDSDTDNEYAECATKAAVLAALGTPPK